MMLAPLRWIAQALVGLGVAACCAGAPRGGPLADIAVYGASDGEWMVSAADGVATVSCAFTVQNASCPIMTACTDSASDPRLSVSCGPASEPDASSFRVTSHNGPGTIDVRVERAGTLVAARTVPMHYDSGCTLIADEAIDLP